MSTKIKLLIVALALVVAGGLALAFGDTKGPEPALVCVEEGGPTSGFTDGNQGDCPISIESWREYAEWLSKPQPVRIAGLFTATGGVLLAIGVGITAAIQKIRK